MSDYDEVPQTTYEIFTLLKRDVLRRFGHDFRIAGCELQRGEAWRRPLIVNPDERFHTADDFVDGEKKSVDTAKSIETATAKPSECSSSKSRAKRSEGWSELEKDWSDLEEGSELSFVVDNKIDVGTVNVIGHAGS